MRFVVIGTHGTGKTTLVRDILTQWPWIGTGAETYREYAERVGLKIGRGGSLGDQKKLLAWSLAQWEGEDIMDREWVVMDRSPLDVYLYSLPGLVGDGDDDFLAKIFYLLRGWVLLWVRPVRGGTVPDDGFRDTDPVYQVEVDARFEAWLARYGKTLTYTEVAGDRRERLELVARLIGRGMVP